MKRIRQHGTNNELYDIKSFLDDLDQYLQPIEWRIQVEWCMGDDVSKVETASTQGDKLSHDEFKRLYTGIHQTIDGTFRIKGLKGSAQLVAFDSSFWEVTSDVEGFEDHMLKKYGEYAA